MSAEPVTGGRPLVLSDISDQRAYERERETFRREVIALKRLRRIALGPVLTVVFENWTTIRFQVQEMARAERMTTDEQIQVELDTYAPLIPRERQCSATLFVELTSEAELREWLPKLAGIENSLAIRITAASGEEVVPGVLDPAHASQLTRPEVTAAVHYLRFSFTKAQAEQLLESRLSLASDHLAYQYSSPLSHETVQSLLDDWKPHETGTLLA